MPGPNQISSRAKSGEEAQNILFPQRLDRVQRREEITEKSLRWNIDVGLQYLYAWLGGTGFASIYKPDGGRGHR